MSTYRPVQNAGIYGLHIPYGRGYDARSRKRGPVAEGNQPSGYLRAPDGSQVSLWITDVTADFSLSGETGQSRMLREFFPRSFNDVVLNVTGNVSSTQEFNRLSVFVREMQWRALQAINQGSTASQMLTLHIFNNTPHWGQARTVKGGHRPWTVNGYIKQMAGGAVAQEVAPQFQLEFIVAESLLNGNTGIWSDTAAGITPLKTILDLVNVAKAEGKISGGFIKDPVVTVKSQSGAPGNKAVHEGAQSVVWSVQGAVDTLGGALETFL